MPQFIFSFSESVDALAQRLAQEAVVPMFRKLHPEKSGWNMSLVNIAATNMAQSAGEQRDSKGRDIEKMFRRQEQVLRDWKVEDRDAPPSDDGAESSSDVNGREHELDLTMEVDVPSMETSIAATRTEDSAWDSDDDAPTTGDACKLCGAVIPHFAVKAHEIFHTIPD
jgi:DNA polymerase iota